MLLTIILSVFLLSISWILLTYLISIDWKRSHKIKSGNFPNYENSKIQEYPITNIVINDLEFRARILNPKATGEAIFLLHGFPQTSISWEPVFEALKNTNFRVIAYDQRGYSPNARPKNVSDYDTKNLIDDLFSIATKLGIEKFHLVGHDWGAAIGWAATMSKPERILTYSALSIPHSLAFFSALKNNKSQRKKSRYILFFQIPWIPEMILISMNLFFLKRWIIHLMPHEHQKEYFSVFSEFGAMNSVLKYYRAMGKSKKFDYQPEIMLPVLFIWGNIDPAVSRDAVNLQDQFIQGYYKKIELNTGHWLLETATKEVVSHITKHLDRRKNI